MSGSSEAERPAAAPGGPSSEPAPQPPPCTIFITGEVNSGKSSLLNALSGGLVSNASLQRETFNPIEYHYSKDGTEANLRAITEQLEAAHKQNEELRTKLDTLAEEKVSSTQRFDCTLPVRYNLAPLTLIDFPGINDAEDEKKQLFFTAIRNKVSEADLIIFVTDAMTAFSKASEITQFRKIQQLVKQENDSGHFVDLVVVVNKFDTTSDKDLRDILSRIPDKLADFDKEKLFCFSSHKMLLDNVIKCKLDLYLPLFNRAELQRILKTCNVTLSTAALKRIKKEGLLRHSDIVVQPDLANGLVTTSEDEEEEQNRASTSEHAKRDNEVDDDEDDDDPLNTPAYYELIQHLSRFQTRLSQSKVDIAVAHLTRRWAELKEYCRLYRDTEARSAVTAVMALRERFEYLNARQSYEEQFLLGLTDISKLHCADTTRAKTSGDIVKLLLVFAWHKYVAMEEPVSLITHVLTNLHHFALDIHHTFAHFFIMQPRRPSLMVRWNKPCRDWLVYFASCTATYTAKEWTTYWEPNPGSIKSTIDSTSFQLSGLKPLTGVRLLSPNPVVQNLLHLPHAPVELRMLLKLAVTPLAYLSEMDHLRELPYELLEETLPGMMRPLRLLMLQPALFDPQQPLLHRLFNMATHFPSLLPHKAFLSEWELLAKELRAQAS